MDTEMKFSKSLPPLVEGQIHGYLKFVIHEVLWSNRNLGDITVFATWWGETDSAHFRPAQIRKNVIRSEQETTTVYAIRTSINLFQEYVRNCESIKLVIFSDAVNTIIGTSQVTDLLDIFNLKSCSKYVDIINNAGDKVGELHVSMKLEYTTRSSNMQLKVHTHQKIQDVDDIVPSKPDTLRSRKDVGNDIYTNMMSGENEIYKSILKMKRPEYQEPLKKFNSDVINKLITQVVERAQKLRGAILKETSNENPFDLSHNSLNATTHISAEDEAKLYEYVLGKDMTSSEEKKVLSTLRSTSPTPSLIDLASINFDTCGNDNGKMLLDSTFHTQTSSVEETKPEEKHCIRPKEHQLLNCVDCIRIFVESFTLNSAGYRRVKSSSLSHNSDVSKCATYFVQYDITYDTTKEAGKRLIRKSKPVKICSKKHTDEVIYFNHDSVYSVSKLISYSDYLIKFKVFIRHFNKKSLTELGTGTMHVNDIIKSENWSIAQRLIIVNKGMKVGDLSIIAELGSDSIHFGKEYIDGVMSTKENIPILETQQVLNGDRSRRNKSVAGAHSKTSSQVSSVSSKELKCLTSDTDMLTTKDETGERTDKLDGKRVDTKNQENNVQNQILLHGFIYVAEGKELPELNTYLICRAFWKEDKCRSQVCNNTKNPFYQFSQLVPLIYDSDLLDRIKDNYIIIEVYCRNNKMDNLLGLAKLPVHQLYIAYRDPRVLPYLLLSKDPIVCVDGWVSIIDPVTGQFRGQLLALVALGTAEQIALLQMSRGLRNVGSILHTMCCHKSATSCIHDPQNTQHSLKHSPCEFRSNDDRMSANESQHFGVNTAERESHCSNMKSQESQTDISTVKEMKFISDRREESSNSDESALHNLVGRLTQVLNVNKASIDQIAQTEVNLKEQKQMDREEQMCVNELNFNNSSDDSDIGSIRHNYHLPTDEYRSVGVGAEYDAEQLNSDSNNTAFELPTIIHREKDSIESTSDQTMFRAIVEIECALYLPKIERVNETIEPSTYVTFQANKHDFSKQLHSCAVTNVYPNSCNPKWNWKCDIKLPTELLLHDEKRLILKIWRILDEDGRLQVDLNRDIVIGFSAIDLSVLLNGFPTVSGWFHIMDFTGKCNGQIKVCITPLDNLSLFGKTMSSLSTTRLPSCNAPQQSYLPSQTYEMRNSDTEGNNIDYTLSMPIQKDDKSVHSESQSFDCAPNIGFEDVSMSFLSLSLKQKLTELDEITKRLQSRLHDVTNAAFEEDFENEFDLNELSSDNENSDCKNLDAMATSIAKTNCANRPNQVSQKFVHDRDVENGNPSLSREQLVQTCASEPSTSCNGTRYNCESLNVPDSSEVSKPYSAQNSLDDNYQTERKNDNLSQHIVMLGNSFADYPERGTRTHINYLLDQLSLKFTPQQCSSITMPMRKDIMHLLTNLQQNNNSRDSSRCHTEAKTCIEPTQTDDTNEQCTKSSENQTINNLIDEKDVNLPEVSAQSQTVNKMSTVIREELVAEENSDSPKYDELTTYLITSNVRHMDFNNVFNPLLYQHLVPDVHYSNASPEEDAIEQLDNRYSKAFTAAGNKLKKVSSLIDVNTSLTESGEFFRMTPSGVSENVDDNVDVTVLHKSSYNDLLASDTTESTITISPKVSSVKLMDAENSYSTSSETTVATLSRQAPDGGNPIEDVTKSLYVAQQKYDIQDSSSSSCI